ncbi:MAG: hypothetical protein PWQ25_2076 [Deferribacteres bacterium]|nr:type phosphodiesterase/nucleotide pyrophosphatase [Deferribacteraceae bacterium]MDK2793213.1 hypothetical protein [Deferribacteres bacterium]
MKRIIFYIIIFIFTISLTVSYSYQSIVMISVDALHPDAISKTNCPNIYSFIEGGFYLKEGKSTNPPKTLIAHTSMLTGMLPEKNGKTDNLWKSGEKKVGVPTIFTTAKKAGYETVYIYSKEKLGYLADDYVDREIFSRDGQIEEAVKIFNPEKKQFIFLHISGLDIVGPESGWLSGEYIEEFRFIDEMLGYFFDKIKRSKSYLLVITSDHAGHERIHGSNHPEDFKRPVIFYSNAEKLQINPKEVAPIEKLKYAVEKLYLR